MLSLCFCKICWVGEFLSCGYQDYTGKAVTVDNLFAVILGDKKAVNGGSGKVVDSGPDDHIFIYYADHGGPGVLGELSVPLSLAGMVSDHNESSQFLPVQKSQMLLFTGAENACNQILKDHDN